MATANADHRDAEGSAHANVPRRVAGKELANDA
jgi:hypothetical protein